MYNPPKSSFTLKAEETAARAEADSAQRATAFAALTQHGIALAKAKEEARQHAVNQQAFQDIAQGITTVAVSLAAASKLREPSPTLRFTPSDTEDGDTRKAQQSKALPASSTTQLTIEDKIEPDNLLKELENDVKDLEKKLSRLYAKNDTSETAYKAWLQQQKDMIEEHAEPTAVGVFRFDSYETWKTKITNHQQLSRDRLLPQLAEAREKYQQSYAELKLAQRDYGVALYRQYVVLTKDDRMSWEEASAHLNVYFKDRKTFDRELYAKDIQRATEHSKHPLAPVIPRLVKGEDVSASLKSKDFHANPTPAGISTIMIDHTNRLFIWYLQRSGVSKDQIIKNLATGTKVLAKTAGVTTGTMFGLEASSMLLDNFKVDPGAIEQCRNELDISINAARKMIALEAGLDIAKVNALYTQLDQYFAAFQEISVHSEIRTHANVLLLQNRNERADACKAIYDYKQKHQSYAQPQFY